MDESGGWAGNQNRKVASRRPVSSGVLPLRDWKSSKSYHEEREEWNSTISQTV